MTRLTAEMAILPNRSRSCNRNRNRNRTLPLNRLTIPRNN